MAVLSVKNLSVVYDGFEAIQDLSFTLEDGDYLCVVGENGSGKSTLMKTLLGLLKPNSGEIKYDNLSSAQIGYMPQQTAIQRDFPASVMEVVLTGCLKANGVCPFFKKSTRELALKNLERVGALSLAKKCYGELSGGQQQRVLLARALCSTQKLLILDEPVANLDPKATNELYELISKLNREEKITVIMVSHDIRCAVLQASKVLHLDKTLLFFGKTEDYINSDEGQKFLGHEHCLCGGGN